MNKKPKILVVDDKPENIFALRTVLKNMDVELVETTSGNDALKATLHHDFALALLDIQMPEMDGYELAGYIAGRRENSAFAFYLYFGCIYR